MNGAALMALALGLIMQPAEAQLNPVGPFGGPGGGPFDDAEFYEGQRVAEIEVHHSSLLDSIQLVYDVGPQPPAHGLPNGNLSTFVIPPGTHISQVCVSILNDIYIGSIEFWLSNGTVSPIYGELTSDIHCAGLNNLAYISGRSGWWMDELTFWETPVRPSPTNECSIGCPTLFDPVCGANGVTYQNPCFAECEDVPVEHNGECESCNNMCPTLFEPVCGVNGVTYDNPCIAECLGVDILHVGPCNDDTWELQASHVCFFAAYNDPSATFSINLNGIVDGVRLVHNNGRLLCTAGPAEQWGTFWGCNDDFPTHLGVYLTRKAEPVSPALPPVLFPELSLVTPVPGNSFYEYADETDNIPELLFDNGAEFAVPVAAGDEFTLWYTEVYTNFTAGGNSGFSCSDVYFHYVA